MYKIILRNFGIKSIFNRERVLTFKNKEEVIEAVEKLKNCNYYILDEKENVVTVEDLIKMVESNCDEGNIIFVKEIGSSKIKIYSVEKSGKFNINLKIENKSELYRICMDDDDVFVRMEIFMFYKELLYGLQDINMIKETLNMIFN